MRRLAALAALTAALALPAAAQAKIPTVIASSGGGAGVGQLATVEATVEAAPTGTCRRGETKLPCPTVERGAPLRFTLTSATTPPWTGVGEPLAGQDQPIVKAIESFRLPAGKTCMIASSASGTSIKFFAPKAAIGEQPCPLKTVTVRIPSDIGGDSLSSYGVAVRFAGSARYLPSTGALALFSL
jgi:hypothetical protein